MSKDVAGWKRLFRCFLDCQLDIIELLKKELLVWML
jgi:hypothetical protein